MIFDKPEHKKWMLNLFNNPNFQVSGPAIMIAAEIKQAIESEKLAGVNEIHHIGKKKTKFKMTIKTLTEKVHLCTRCPLAKTNTHYVFGEGSAKADLMFIGEAPGADEDRKGLPFVGLTGKLLRSTIDAVGIKIPKIFITNTLMCRPPQNRDPTTEELEICKPWLNRKIELINPKILVSVGRFSTAHVLGMEPNKVM